MIPGTVEVGFNFRFSTAVTEAALRQRVEAILDKHGLDYELRWRLSGQPFLTPEGELVRAARTAVQAELGVEARLSTSGGTSDGRFIAPTGAEVVELGPVNATIHKADEWVAAETPGRLSRIYRRILEELLINK